MAEPMDIHARMLQVANDLNDGISKGGRNVDQGYSFRGIDQVMDALHGPMTRAGIIMLPDYDILSVEDRPTKSGGTMQYARVKGTFIFQGPVDMMVVSTIGQGNDTSDKAVNKAMSAALKYALLQTFMVPIGDGDGDSETLEMGGNRQASAPARTYDSSDGIPVQRVRDRDSGGGKSSNANWVKATPEEIAQIERAVSANPDNEFMRSISQRLREKGEWSSKQKDSALKTAKDLVGPMPYASSSDGPERVAAAFPGAVPEDEAPFF